jgi:succinyl-diaminopimelate desuccinylase
MSGVADALTKTLFDITAIPSFIGEEKALCDHLEARMLNTFSRDEVVRDGDSLIVYVKRGSGGPKVGLVGHTDTVRTQHDGPVRIEDGRLYGAGAADMKSGLAVMIELAERLDRAALGCDLLLVFYEREEGPFLENRLGPLLGTHAALRELDLAVCLEPSDNKLQLGCMGSIHATVTFHGRTAHSARPWQGENAITKAASFLADLGTREPHEVTLDGFTFREVMSPTLASGGRGKNVVPDRFEVNVNFRFAPGRTPDDALGELRAFVGDRAEVVATDLSPSGRPHRENALVKRLYESGAAALEVKQAWTDVARFDALGVPAVNFGPGTQAQAHQRNEWTELSSLAAGYDVLFRFLTAHE